MITAKELREILDYDPNTGDFYWRVKISRSFQDFVPGTRKAGCLNHQGYRVISIRNRQQQAHRLAWLHYYGSWPELDIDHVNACRSDNRIQNLRLATATQNNANRKIAPRNKSGFKGVRKKWAKWEASIWLNKRSVHLGTFDTPEEAHAAYCEAARASWGQYARAE